MNAFIQKHKINCSWLIPCAFGVAAFFLVLGPLVLNPSNIGWLAGGFDPTQHYLGWAFFHQGPWTFPLGLNPNFGLDISSSIVYSDSIPIFAIIFKFWTHYIAGPIQYFGIWMLVCFVAQAITAWLIMGLITGDRLLRLIASIYFLFAPILLWRFVVTNSLAAQFLILVGLYLVLRQKQNYSSLAWIILLSLAASIHFYLLAMVSSLWIVSLMKVDSHESVLRVFKSRFLSFIFTLIVLVFVFWQVGYFAVSGGSAASGSYGIGHLNLIGLFDSNGYSYLLPDLRETPASYNSFDRALSHFEGFSYLGLGLIMCLGFALWGLRYRKVSLKNLVLRYRFLVLMLGLLTLFAISNNIGIGPWNITFPLPESVRSVASILRASARMFWPVYYALILLIFYIIIKSYSRKVAIAILSVGLLIQIADTSAGWLPLRHKLMQPKASEWGSSLTDPFWNQAAEKYKKVVIVPEMNFAKGWKDIAGYAEKNGMATNAVYLARVNQNRLSADNERFMQKITQGAYDPDTLYLIDKDLVRSTLKTLSPRDALIVVNQQFVIVPNYAQCDQCQISSAQLRAGKNTLSPSLGEEITFNANGFGWLLLQNTNWGEAEPWGTWSSGNLARLVMPLPLEGAKYLTLTTRAFITPKHPTQEVGIAVNSSPRQELTLIKDSNNQIVIPITKADQQAGYLSIEFKFQNPARPKVLGLGDDDRLLSIGIEKAVFQ